MVSCSVVFLQNFCISSSYIEKQQVAQNEAPRDRWEVVCNVVTSKFVLTPAFKWHAFVNLSKVSRRNKLN